MGAGSSSQLILLFLSALERALRAQGYPVPPGTGTAAAGDALSTPLNERSPAACSRP